MKKHYLSALFVMAIFLQSNAQITIGGFEASSNLHDYSQGVVEPSELLESTEQGTNRSGDCLFTATINEGDMMLCEGGTLELSTQTYDSYSWFASIAGEDSFGDFSDGSNMISQPDAEVGMFEIFVQVSLDGCTANSDTVLVEVVDAIIPIISGPTELCFGESFTMTVDNAEEFSAFQWVVGGVNVPFIGTSSTLSYEASFEGELDFTVETELDSEQCPNSSSTSEPLLLTINPLPEPTVELEANILMTQSFESYQWYFNGAIITEATDQTYSAEEDGEYYVVVTGENGCDGQSDSFSFIIDGIPSLESVISVYPNPAKDLLTIEGFETGTVAIYNMLGEKVLDKLLTSTANTALDVSALSNGIYVIRFNSKGTEFSKAFIKE